ncbi:uncharacterized protein PRCAT00004007001 [Priceomyces carsonii]|uniref:uncharacterized protein n=1 Tax=Priceomyces carsonii TaxID=28549 RepID=UPI002ED9E765|nr:unnamed protein product [Priceomyces carsonii]
MDQILAKASSQAVTFAIRSGISLASGFAIKTISKFLDRIPEQEKRRILVTKNKIQTKISILSVSIELIRLAAARGNTSLEYTLTLINDLNNEFEMFDDTVEAITNGLNNSNEMDSVKKVEKYMEDLLSQINESIPILNLSLVTCGVSLNGNLPGSISPGRLLQASNYLVKSNENFNGSDPIRVGPSFDMVFYTVFYNPSRLKYINEEDNEYVDELTCISWKEQFARSVVTILREPNKNDPVDYRYLLQIEEDFNDSRYHDEDSTPQVRKIDIDTISRLFFSASGKLLRLENRSSSVLTVKLIDNDNKEEWIALGEIKVGEFDDQLDTEEEDDDDDDDDDENQHGGSKERSSSNKANSLSLLEYLIRLTKVQLSEQKSVLEVTDEKLSIYLKDENEEQSKIEIVPKSKVHRDKERSKSSKLNESITLTSNIDRLKILDLDK